VQQLVESINATEVRGNFVATPPRRRIAGRMGRLLFGTVLWLTMISLFLGTYLALAIFLAVLGIESSKVSFLLGLAILPLILIIRRLWRVARSQLLPTEIELFFERQDAKMW
jgi:cellulose synthase/poly-beta-1,6-N-acetylglucosamine synthase-like glycosyltransferase